MPKDEKPKSDQFETVFDLGSGNKVTGPKGSRMILKLIIGVLSALGVGTAGTFGIKEYIATVEKREAERAAFEDARYDKLEHGLGDLIQAVNELKTELRVTVAQKSEYERRFAAIEAELKVQGALMAAIGDKFVRREDHEETKRQLNRALQDIAELKAKSK